MVVRKGDILKLVLLILYFYFDILYKIFFLKVDLYDIYQNIV